MGKVQTATDTPQLGHATFNLHLSLFMNARVCVQYECLCVCESVCVLCAGTKECIHTCYELVGLQITHWIKMRPPHSPNY